jgi:hypothetical protein
MARSRLFASTLAGLLLASSCSLVIDSERAFTSGDDAQLGNETDGGGIDSGAECVPGTKQCVEGEKLQKCVGGRWVDVQICQPPLYCLGEMCRACYEGELGCNGQRPFSCNSEGGKDLAAPCREPTPACVAGACQACAPGTTQCRSPKLIQYCEAPGNWGEGFDCSNLNQCLNNECVQNTPPFLRIDLPLPYSEIEADDPAAHTLFLRGYAKDDDDGELSGQIHWVVTRNDASGTLVGRAQGEEPQISLRMPIPNGCRGTSYKVLATVEDSAGATENQDLVFTMFGTTRCPDN